MKSPRCLPRPTSFCLLAMILCVLSLPIPADETLPPQQFHADPDTFAPGDSTAVAVASAADSLVAQIRQLHWWEPDWLLGCLGPGSGERLLTREILYRSSAMLFSDALGRDSRLYIFSSGSHGAWELPCLLGPGVDRFSLWFDGASTVGPAIPEAHCQTLSPLLLEQAWLVAPDAFLDPLAAGGDGMLWTSQRQHRWEDVPSAIRLTEGRSGSSTEDIMLGRQVRAWRVLGSYAHSHTDGRQQYPNGRQRYEEGRFQNLLLQVDRAAPCGTFRLVGADRAGRYHLYGGRRLSWESSQLSGGSQLRLGKSLRGQMRLTQRYDRLQWRGDGDAEMRRTKSTAATLQGSAGWGAMTLLMSAGIDHTSLFLGGEAREDTDWTAIGTGIALGAKLDGGQSAGMVTLGYADPWWHGGHLRGHLAASLQPCPRLGMVLEAWTAATTVFIPRLEPDPQALLEEGLHLTGGAEPSGKDPVRRLWHGEIRMQTKLSNVDLSCGVLVRRITDGLGLEPEHAQLLRPEARTDIALDGILSDATLTGAYGSGRIQLPLGAAILGDLTTMLYPLVDELPVLVPPYHGRGVFLIGGRLFKGDLGWQLRLLCDFQGRWCTPEGQLPASVRFNGEIHGTFGDAHFFLILRNLANSWDESATYDEAWGSLPFRSSQTGVEWHFRD